MDWYPFYPTDYKRKTYHLTLAQDGAYRRLIDEYMITRAPLPDDDMALARILVITPQEWAEIAPVVRAFFWAGNGVLRHKTCDGQLAAQDLRQLRYSKRGKKAAIARYSKINGMPARSMHRSYREHKKEEESTSSEPNPAREAPPEPPPESGGRDSKPGQIPITPALQARIDQWKREGKLR